MDVWKIVMGNYFFGRFLLDSGPDFSFHFLAYDESLIN